MERLNLSTRQLDAFLALADARHFTRAAERCHLSQPAFSQLIRRLEDATGARLFDRSTRNVTLTPEGEIFARAARRIADDVASAVASLRDHAAARSGHVAIAALPSIAAEWLPEVLAAFRRCHPGVTVELFDSLSDRCLALVREGRAEFALTASGPNLAEFDVRPLYDDRYWLVCRRDHPLARRRAVRLDDLAGRALIHLARSSSVRQHLEPLLRDVPYVWSGLEVEQLATLAGLVANGLGVTLVPELTLFQFRRPELAIVPVRAAELGRPIFVVRRKGRALSVAAAAMLDLVTARLRGRKSAGATRDRGALRPSARSAPSARARGPASSAAC
ncbi:MAG TPA: LysR family transcriptional regulator [Burkholderiales bacterium]|nr:LysR family transcriptional regulator [Burkholderiales bacterium]